MADARFEGSVAVRERARGHFAAPEDLSLPGLARQRRYLLGESEPPAIHHLTGLEFTRVAPGRATFALPASRWLSGPAGVYPGGISALVADAPLSGAVISELDAGQVVTTSELTFQLVRPAVPSSGTIVADARTVHVGAHLGLSSCEVTDGSGRLLAHGTARNVIISADAVPEGAEGDGQSPVDPDAERDGPDPWQREVEGEVMPPDVWDRPGLEVAEAACAGELPAPPIAVLTGCFPTACGEGWEEWVAPTSAWWCSPAPYLYGGMLAMFAEAVLSGTLSTVSPGGVLAATVDLHVRFLRPVFPGTGELRARGDVVHRGRNLRVARCTIQDAEGRTVLLAESSAVLVPPRALLGEEIEDPLGAAATVTG